MKAADALVEKALVAHAGAREGLDRMPAICGIGPELYDPGAIIETQVKALKILFHDVCLFAEMAARLRLRQYQQQVAQAVISSVLEGRGDSFVIIFPRQSGKNELQAQIEAYLLFLLSQARKCGVEMVKVSPTWKPQSLNAMHRLERVLKGNFVTTELWTKESGYIYKIGRARMAFLSGAPVSNVVGATASALLECDEAQDVSTEKWDREINPMAASTNATRVFWGTAWTSDTLLAREERAARQAQEQDGRRRVFKLTAEEVGAEIPAYRKFVDGEIDKLGRSHPFVRTQFYSEEINAQAGIFTPARQALMRGEHAYESGPAEDEIYAFLVDVAGSDETSQVAENPAGLGSRDSTALTILRIDLSTLDILQAPTYRVVNRCAWLNAGQPELYAQLSALAEHWQPRYIVIDATGLGEGLAGFLARSRQGVIPFKFSQQSKSQLAWTWVAIIETGRYLEYCLPLQVSRASLETGPVWDASGLQREFFEQLNHIQSEIIPGPGRLLHWSVPPGVRDGRGNLVHDDLVMSAALVAELEGRPWGNARSAIIEAIDPLGDLEF